MAYFWIHTDRTASDMSALVLRVDGSLDDHAARQLRYHAEAAVFIHAPCEVHVNLAGVDIAADAALVCALLAARATANRRFSGLHVCAPPRRLCAVLDRHGIPVCDGHQPPG